MARGNYEPPQVPSRVSRRDALNVLTKPTQLLPSALHLEAGHPTRLFSLLRRLFSLSRPDQPPDGCCGWVDEGVAGCCASAGLPGVFAEPSGHVDAGACVAACS